MWRENVRETDHLEDQHVDGIILNTIINYQDCKAGVNRTDLAQDGHKWQGICNEPSGSIKCGVFTD
jgi:hypothetical protein